MPLVALQDGGRVCVLDHETPAELRAAFPHGSCCCPDCESPFVLKAGMIRTPHFAHAPDAACRPLESKPESIAHLAGKAELARLLREQYGREGARVELEYRFPTVSRIADIAVLFPSGLIDVHEIQLASLTVEQLAERTRDYERAGVGSVVWWLGEANARPTGAVMGWLRSNCASFGLVDFETTFSALPLAGASR